MNRLAPNLKLRIDRIDLMLASALAVVAISYTLGYHLDWSQIEAKTPEEEMAAVPAAPATEPVAAVMTARKISPNQAQPELRADPREEAWEAMTQELNRLAAQHQGRVSIYLENLKDGKVWSYHPDDLYP